MFDFPKCTKLRLMLILSLQDLLQNLNLEVNPIDNVEPHCPHDNIGGNHWCNECRIVPIVCHMLDSIFVTDRASLLTDHRSTNSYQVQFFIKKTIWEQTSGNSPMFSNSSSFIW